MVKIITEFFVYFLIAQFLIVFSYEHRVYMEVFFFYGIFPNDFFLFVITGISLTLGNSREYPYD